MPRHTFIAALAAGLLTGATTLRAQNAPPDAGAAPIDPATAYPAAPYAAHAVPVGAAAPISPYTPYPTGGVYEHEYAVYGYGEAGTYRKPNPWAIWLGLQNGCTYSPDHGWTRPTKRPIHRIPVQYYRYWPTGWYGTGTAPFVSAYPVVHMPTDTTQLGYYYQRVPTWQPNPGMIPPAPWPNAWMHRECPWTQTGLYGAYAGHPVATPVGYGHGAYGPTVVVPPAEAANAVDVPPAPAAEIP